MAKAQIKTQETEASVADFINTVADEQKRKDCFVLVDLMEKATGDKAKMWGGAIIGFGKKAYVSPTTGREVDWMKIAFSPRKASLTLYLIGLDAKTRAASLEKLGKHKTKGGCIYVNKLTDIDMNVLEGMISSVLKSK